jgi:hypothetical protein
MNDFFRAARLRCAVAMLMLGCATSLFAADKDTPAAAAPAKSGPDPLALERWSERSYGISLRPPLGSRLMEQTGDESILRIVGANGEYTCSMSIKKPVRKTEAELVIENVVEDAIRQISISQPSARLVDKNKIKPAGKPGGVIFLTMPPTKRDPKPWVLGQAFMLIDPETALVIRLDVEADKFERTRPIFEAMVMSLGVEKPEDIDRERQAQIEASDEWRKTVTSKKLAMALVSEQWFRVTEGKTDVGYTRVQQSVGRSMDASGIQIDIQARVQVEDKTYESVSQFFLSDDGNKEVWSVKTTVMPLNATPEKTAAKKPSNNRKSLAPDVITWSETGVRSGADITLNRDTPTGSKQFKWQRPPRGYLSQAELYLLDVTLPRQQAQTYGFYAYYANSGRVTFRAERIAPEPSGGFRVFSRPSPEQPEQMSVFDAQGKLLRRELPGGRVMTPTTFEQVRSIWKLQG